MKSNDRDSVATFRVDPKMQAVLDNLKTKYGAASRSEILRRAVVLLELASEAQEQGGEVVIRKGDKERSIILG